jgi:hypothetical protein
VLHGGGIAPYRYRTVPVSHRAGVISSRGVSYNRNQEGDALVRKIMRPLLLLLFGCGLALAQPFSAGLKVGLPLTDFLNTVNGVASTSTDRYLLGAEAELHLPLGLGIEFDAIYRHFNYTSPASSAINALTSTGSVGNWEFPLLAKYKFPSKIVRPYVEAGVAWDTLTGVSATATQQKNTVSGAVIGAGLDIKALVVHISPELRFTRWTSQYFTVPNVLNSNQNQAEVLVGITF